MNPDDRRPGPVLIAALLVLLSAVNFFWFPGHTWLQSDTQIYVPILEHIADPGAYRLDPGATRPHVAFTIYDETALALRRLTSLDLDTVLHIQQWLFRLCGLAGVYLLAGAAGLPPVGALFAAAAFGLGAVVNGPSVLTFEYEPVPRGFAGMLIFAALGCAARNLWPAAGAFAVLATLYHPTTTAPFWVCAAVWFVWRASKAERRALAMAVAAAGVLLFLAARFQAGPPETQPFFGRIDADLEALQRLRGAYNWIGLWPRDWFWQYPLLFAFVVAAWRRLGDRLNPAVRFFSLALPIVGLLTIALQWLLLDQLKWIFMPQFQPARAVLYITAFAMILGAFAAWHAAQARRFWEAGLWLSVVFALPLNGLVLNLFTGLPDALHIRRVGLLVVLCLMGAAALGRAHRRPAVAIFSAAAPFVLIPTMGRVVNYPDLHHPAIATAASWARQSTPRDAVFLFADAHRHLAPGIFRAHSGRALYVDWKTGGQVNLLPELGREWGRRWQAVQEARPPLLPLDRYAALGIDYLVVSPANLPPDVTPEYRNELYAVIRLP